MVLTISYDIFRITIPDDILESLSLEHLTEKNYNLKRQVLVLRLKSLHSRMQELVVLSLRPKAPCCACLGFKPAPSQYASVSPNDLSESAYKELRTLDAHNNASARLRSYVKSRVGKSQIRRMASELWALRRRICDDHTDATAFQNDLNYRFDLLSSPATEEGIDISDIDLFESLFLLKIKHRNATVIKDLDPESTGYLELEPIERWFSDGKHVEYIDTFQQYIVFFGNFIKKMMLMFYAENARLRCLAMFRKMARMDIELHHRTMVKYIKAAERDALSSASKDKQENVDVASFTVKGASSVSLAGSSTVEDSLKEKLNTLKAEYKRGEDRLLFRLTEDDAESGARRHFFSRVGRYQLKHERMLLTASSVMLEAYGYCIPPSRKSLPHQVKSFAQKSLVDDDDGSDVENLKKKVILKMHFK